MAAVNPFAVADVMDELKKVFEDEAYRRAMCDRHMRRCGWTRDSHGWVSPAHSGSHSNVRTAFGEYDRDRYTPVSGYMARIRPKCGVEVVGIRPLAMGATYSRHARLTIPDLTQTCANNGIKVLKTWKKVQYLQALMGI